MRDYRDAVLARLDVRKFMASVGLEPGPSVGTDEVRIHCPVPGHPDETASANINLRSGLWHCHACDDGGSPIDLLMRRGSTFREALTEIGRLAGMEPPVISRQTRGMPPTTVTKGKLTEANVRAWHEAALRHPELMRWFYEHRGFTSETIDRFELGWDGSRITIPVRNASGDLVNVRRYMRDARASDQKVVQLMAGAGPDVTTRLYPNELLAKEVLLVEGEWDAMICAQNGLTQTRTMTAGAGNWNATWTPGFADHVVTICYDNDEAGRRGGQRIARILSNVAAEVRILHIPNLPDKGDVTDFFVSQSRSVVELQALINEATPYAAAPDDDSDVEPTVVALHRASSAEYQGTRLAIPALVSGKAVTPYTVPYEYDFHCPMSNRRYCSICPMQEANGIRHVKLNAADRAVLSLIGVSASQQTLALRTLAKAVPACNLGTIEVKAAINIEELRLIPELDVEMEADEHEYVTRQGFLLGHGLMPNRSYTLKGYSHPHPKSQATVHVLSEAIPAQDHIGSFVVTPDIVNSLSTFCVDGRGVAGKLQDIYDDLRLTVHRIHGRFDMQIAFDLVWHSVIGFTFNGAFVRRGWVEAMVMGDSGQGKSEMAQGLLGHYRMGARLPAEQTSMAGLIGGLEKLGDNWMLGWGQIPLNDKRLLVIDEAQGLSSSAIEAMSDVRASGIAEVTKIRTERTNARCRLIWLANPVSGITLAQHNQGVLAVKDLFKKPEDIRRLDLAIAVASGDVDVARQVNVLHATDVVQRYTSELCRKLVLWAWSRRPDQVMFEPDATDEILAAATVMGRHYHPSIPLVEPADQRLKLARLAAAIAARLFSTDDGERLIVKAEHVRFVVDYLDRAYNAPNLAYGEYSDAMRRTESLDGDELARAKETIRGWANDEGAIAFLRAARVFKKNELIDVVGWDDSYAKDQLRFLAANRLITSAREGYRKTPIFISLLRDLNGTTDIEALLSETADAPF
ncbi:MAG TPA: toprim domain-containing protein [Candidatus Limnocylindrales bacterium]